MSESQMQPCHREPRSAGYVRPKQAGQRHLGQGVDNSLYSEALSSANSVHERDARLEREQREQVGLREFLEQLDQRLSTQNEIELEEKMEVKSDTINIISRKVRPEQESPLIVSGIPDESLKPLKKSPGTAHELLYAMSVLDPIDRPYSSVKPKKRNSNVKNLTVSIPNVKRSIPRVIRSGRLRSRRILTHSQLSGHGPGPDSSHYIPGGKRTLQLVDTRVTATSIFDQKASLNLPRSAPPSPESVDTGSLGPSASLQEPISPVSPGPTIVVNLHVPRVPMDSPRAAALAKKQVNDFKCMLSNFLVSQKEHEAKVYRRALVANQADDVIPFSFPPPTIPLPKTPSVMPIKAPKKLSLAAFKLMSTMATEPVPSSKPFSIVHGAPNSTLYADRPLPLPPFSRIHGIKADANPAIADSSSSTNAETYLNPTLSEPTKSAESFQAMKETISRISGHESYVRAAKSPVLHHNHSSSLHAALPQTVTSYPIREERIATSVEMMPGLSHISTSSDPSTCSIDRSKDSVDCAGAFSSSNSLSKAPWQGTYRARAWTTPGSGRDNLHIAQAEKTRTQKVVNDVMNGLAMVGEILIPHDFAKRT